MRSPSRKRAGDTHEGPPAESNVEIDVESLVVAHYAVDLSMSYEEIQDIMALSRATVARRLQHAKSSGWLVEKPSLYIPENLQELYDQRTRETDLQKRLLDRLERENCGLRSATIVFDKQVTGDRGEITRRIGQAAAARLVNAVANRGGTVGINWGHAMMRTVDYLPKTESSGRRNLRLRFVPLMGNFSLEDRPEELYEEALLCSANRLARIAGEQFNTEEPRRLTTPAIISSKFRGDDDKLKIIWEFIEEDISYQRIFGRGHHNPDAPERSKGLVDEMDTVFTGMGGLQKDGALVSIARLVSEPELEVLRNAGYVGDLGGSPIADPKTVVTDSQARNIARELSRLVIGPLPQDFVDIAERARWSGDGRTGVFMVGAGGRAKARALICACRMRAINELFTDRATAQRMLEILDE